jgi:putative two-component system response regulator
MFFSFCSDSTLANGDFMVNPSSLISLPSVPSSRHIGESKGVVLVVDDDPIVRKLTRQMLSKLTDAVHVVASGEDAIGVAPQLDPDLILLDVTMPGMDGFEVCERLRADSRTREVPIIMVTALNDRESRLRGLEVGADDFISKPYDRMELHTRVKTILRVNRYRRLMDEREQRKRAWQGALQVLNDLLAIRDPETFGVAHRLERRAVDLARRLRISDVDTIRLASMFCQLGRLTVPDSVLLKASSNHELSRGEQAIMRSIPESSRRVLAHIPELNRIGNIVYWQDKNYDGTGFPLDDLDGRTIPIASRIIRVARDFEQLIESGLSSDEAQLRLHSQDRWYDPAVLTALDAQILDEVAEYSLRAMTIRLNDLRIGMEILEEILTVDDRLVVVGAGTTITGPLLERLHNFARLKGIREPIVIKRPDSSLNGSMSA